MARYFLESSAFLKRYKNESGSNFVNHLFNYNSELLYLNLAIVEIRKVFFRLWKYPQTGDTQITESEFKMLESRFAADILNLQRVEFTEEMILFTTEILKKMWIKSVFDLAHLSAYLVTNKIFSDLIFVCSDETIANAAKQFVNESNVILLK